MTKKLWAAKDNASVNVRTFMLIRHMTSLPKRRAISTPNFVASNKMCTQSVSRRNDPSPYRPCFLPPVHPLSMLTQSEWSYTARCSDGF